MSSEQQPAPEVKTLFDWPRIAMGVIIMIARTSMAAAIGFALSIGVPLSVSATEPPKFAEVEADILVAEADLPEEEKTKWLAIAAQKAKAAGAAVRDKIWDPDEALEERTADLKRAQEEIAKLRKQVADARFKAGTDHEYVLQCTQDLADYLSTLQKPGD